MLPVGALTVHVCVASNSFNKMTLDALTMHWLLAGHIVNWGSPFSASNKSGWFPSECVKEVESHRSQASGRRVT